VPLNDSLLTACGDGKIETRIPKQQFFAKDLDPETLKGALEVCLGAGVKRGPLLDACTLDVASIGDERATEAFVGMPLPVFADR
jgi:hypothetical protein